MASYTITTNSLQEATLGVVAQADPRTLTLPGFLRQAVTPGMTHDQVVAAIVNALLAEVGNRVQQQLLDAALDRYNGATAATKTQVLGMMGLSAYAALPPPAQQQAFHALATPAFLALDPATQAQVFKSLGY